MDITNIRRMAKELNLHNIASASLSLFESELPNVEFLELILKTELGERKTKNLYKARKASRLPKATALTKLESVTEWQLNELKKLNWIDDTKNLFIVGNCGSGKTELATTIGSCCLDSGYKVYYIKAESDLIEYSDLTTTLLGRFGKRSENCIKLVNDTEIKPCRNLS